MFFDLYIELLTAWNSTSKKQKRKAITVLSLVLLFFIFQKEFWSTVIYVTQSPYEREILFGFTAFWIYMFGFNRINAVLKRMFSLFFRRLFIAIYRQHLKKQGKKLVIKRQV